MSRYVAFIVLAGCIASQGDEGMVVLNNTASDGATCMLTGDLGQPFVAHGIIDVASPVPYLLTPLIQSRITPIENGDPTQRTILLGGANIDLAIASASSNGAPVSVSLPSDATHFKQLFSGAVPPQGSANVSYDLVPLDAIEAIATATNAASGARVAVEVTTTSTVFGTLGGDTLDAAPFNYGVTVCSNCVINDLGDCALITGTVRTGNPCNPFQDGIVDCCDNGTNLVCPAVATP